MSRIWGPDKAEREQRNAVARAHAAALQDQMNLVAARKVAERQAAEAMDAWIDKRANEGGFIGGMDDRAAVAGGRRRNTVSAIEEVSGPAIKMTAAQARIARAHAARRGASEEAEEASRHVAPRTAPSGDASVRHVRLPPLDFEMPPPRTAPDQGLRGVMSDPLMRDIDRMMAQIGDVNPGQHNYMSAVSPSFGLLQGPSASSIAPPNEAFVPIRRREWAVGGSGGWELGGAGLGRDSSMSRLYSEDRRQHLHKLAAEISSAGDRRTIDQRLMSFAGVDPKFIPSPPQAGGGGGFLSGGGLRRRQGLELPSSGGLFGANDPLLLGLGSDSGIRLDGSSDPLFGPNGGGLALVSGPSEPFHFGGIDGLPAAAPASTSWPLLLDPAPVRPAAAASASEDNDVELPSDSAFLHPVAGPILGDPRQDKSSLQLMSDHGGVAALASHAPFPPYPSAELHSVNHQPPWLSKGSPQSALEYDELGTKLDELLNRPPPAAMIVDSILDAPVSLHDTP